MKSLAEQFSDVARVYGDATITQTGPLHLVVIPRLALPAGWSQLSTNARFVVPDGYPYAPPDCFWADPALRLANGAMPKNTAIGNPVPGQPQANLLWFSWHVGGNWNAGTCKLMTYVNVVRNRFEAVE
jgi:hypothetical protein